MLDFDKKQAHKQKLSFMLKNSSFPLILFNEFTILKAQLILTTQKFPQFVLQVILHGRIAPVMFINKKL